MKTFTKKALKTAVEFGVAKDITGYNFAEMEAFLRRNDVEVIGISHGTYGMTGALLQDGRGNQYAITARNSALFQAV